MKKMEKENFKKAHKNSVFWVFVKKTGLFCKNVIFREIGKHYLCSEGQKKVRIFVATICFWKMVLFWCPFKVTKHYKNRSFSRHRGKPKMALLVAKVPFWVFP